MNETTERPAIELPAQSYSRREERELPAVVPQQATPMSILAVAVQKGMDIATIRELLALQKEWESNEARKAFNEAMAAAKADIPVIRKNQTVDFTSPKGRTFYPYEDLAEIARTVDPILAKHGLSYRFRTTSTPNEPIGVTCIVAHRLGFAEENTLCAGRDDSGNKNSIQSIGSTITYLQRMTLKASLGLSAAVDDDGRSADDQPEEGKKPTGPEPYADADFQADLPKFKKIIESGKKSAQDVITMISSKIVPSEEQKKKILALEGE